MHTHTLASNYSTKVGFDCSLSNCFLTPFPRKYPAGSVLWATAAPLETCQLCDGVDSRAGSSFILKPIRFRKLRKSLHCEGTHNQDQTNKTTRQWPATAFGMTSLLLLMKQPGRYDKLDEFISSLQSIPFLFFPFWPRIGWMATKDSSLGRRKGRNSIWIRQSWKIGGKIKCQPHGYLDGINDAE